jgi:Zn-finger nucleic acid-binding protein
MIGDEVQCPACSVLVPRPDAQTREIECPSCRFVWAPPEELQQTVEHTPMAKRRSSRPA